MLYECHWIVPYTVHFTAFCLGGGAFFPGHGVYALNILWYRFENAAFGVPRTKALISLKRDKIRPRLLVRTNRNTYICTL